jgi:ribosome-associated heat shock protein Hsp15
MTAARVRLDKWLQVARVFKTRSQATRACTLGRVTRNGGPAKPHSPLALDDRIEVSFGDWTRVLVVRELRDRPLPKADAARLYEDLSPPRPVRPARSAIPAAAGRRERGAGRPTKRERRQMDRLRRR